MSHKPISIQKTQKKLKLKRPLPPRVKTESKMDEQNLLEQEDDNVSQEFFGKVKQNLQDLQKGFEQSDPSLNVFDFQSKNQKQRTRTIFEMATLQLGESYHPKVVSCRDQQKLDIQAFIYQGLATKGCRQTLYISGVPGIGKTLCVNQVVKRINSIQTKNGKEEVQTIFVNAMNLKKAKDIFKIIWQKLSGTSKGSINAVHYLNEFFYKGIVQHGKKVSVSSTKIIVIDQIDYLRTKDEQVIYNILEWTQQKRSKIILIAISNTIDFPQTLTQKVASRMGNRRIIFKPYSSKQIETVLKERIQNTNVYEDQAVEYMCKKIAKCSSDIRKCLYIMRQAIAVYITICVKKHQLPKKVPKEVLVYVHQDSFSDILVKNFAFLHPTYKTILIMLAKYFRFQNVACTYTELAIRTKPHIKGGTTKEFSLKPALIQLRDIGLISFRFSTMRTDKRINKGVKLNKQYLQENISLLVPVDSILYAATKDQNNVIPVQE